MQVEIKSKTSAETFTDLKADPTAHLVDVRTHAEWSYVGVPDVPPLKVIYWVRFPDGQQNPDFVSEVEAAGIEKDQPIYLMCRSGVRSLAAAGLLRSQGYTNLTNVNDGFEGDLDADGHRGNINGWRQAGLPWKQS